MIRSSKVRTYVIWNEIKQMTSNLVFRVEKRPKVIHKNHIEYYYSKFVSCCIFLCKKDYRSLRLSQIIKIDMQDDYKEILPRSALVEPVLFNRSRWNFKYSYLKVSAQDSVNGNTVVLTVAVIVTETGKPRMATPTFSYLKMFSAYENVK